MDVTSLPDSLLVGVELAQLAFHLPRTGEPRREVPLPPESGFLPERVHLILCAAKSIQLGVESPGLSSNRRECTWLRKCWACRGIPAKRPWGLLIIRKGGAVAHAQPTVRVRYLRQGPILRAEKKVLDATCFLKRLELSGGRASLWYKSVPLGLHQPTASAPSFPDGNPAGVCTPLSLFSCQKDTLHEGGLTLNVAPTPAPCTHSSLF